MEKYGVEYFVLSDEFKEKNTKTLLEKYGVESIFSSIEIRKKIEKIFIEKYGSKTYTGSEDHKSKLDYNDIARKAWITKIKNGTCSKSKVEEIVNLILIEKYGKENVFRQINIIKQWIDFYIKTINTYLQVDGIYWHGLNRSIEVISEQRTRQDKKIFKQILRDEELNHYMKENNLKLLRITDVQINILSKEDIIKIIEN